jgi:molybdopterin-containing oxidoreductase family iron-sulfur binding subunit
MNSEPPQSDYSAMRQFLAGAGSRDYWRSLEQLSETSEFRDFLDHEFPRQARGWSDATGRREFLKLMAASLALAGASGCLRQPDEKIVPYVHQPEAITPGNPLFYASAMVMGGMAKGVIVKSQMGRPIKIEGNPLHPESLGAADVFAQASILSLYDPDRSRTPLYRQNIETWGRFLTAIKGEASTLRERRGAGLCILTETVTSPTLAGQLEELLDEFPEAAWHQYEPISRDSVRAGSRLAFGKQIDTIYHFDKADVVLSLDGDFLFGTPGSLRYARDFADHRRVATNGSTMSRLYVVETTPSLAGARADHRLPLGWNQVGAFARLVAAKLGVLDAEKAPPVVAGVSDAWLAALVEDLKAGQGRSLVYAGGHQSPEVHALAHAINGKLNNVGQTVSYIEPVEARGPDGSGSSGESGSASQLDSLRSLTDRMHAGDVKVLVMLGGNPVYSAPVDLSFSRCLLKVGLSIHLADHYDETSFLCHWHIPAAHDLESWGDARAFDGTATIIQPLIAPLYDGRTPGEVLSLFQRAGYQSPYDLVRATWKKRLGEAGFDTRFETALHDGVVDDTASPAVQVDASRLDTLNLSAIEPDTAAGEIEVVFRPDATVWDGRFANNGWLQEVPKPLTKIVWDNVALVSPAAAERLSLANQDVVELKISGRVVSAPVWILPGQATNTITLGLGYGRTRAGQTGDALGYNANAVRSAAGMSHAANVSLRKTGRTYPIVSTQHHWSMEGRDLVKETTLDHFREQPNFIPAPDRKPAAEPTLIPEWKYPDHAWGMVIDQTACIGCNACVVACAAENNTPIVGKEQIAVGREMNWIRVDRYYRGGLDNPQVSFQPMFCVHCEMAPCELVCPVGATLHDSEGLNQMVYNRCVGTRYCSNNCPYKVRRFNFFLYSDEQTPSLKLMHNPEVTVRARGVMEKCTYCIQRIQSARIASEIENRPLGDGDVVTACQAACPARAILFGDINDHQSGVAIQKDSPLNYSVLAELNTRPRTTYLAQVRNPNPQLAEPPAPDTPVIGEKTKI